METAEPGTVVVQIQATDQDSGDNGKIVYSLRYDENGKNPLEKDENLVFSFRSHQLSSISSHAFHLSKNSLKQVTQFANLFRSNEPKPNLSCNLSAYSGFLVPGQIIKCKDKKKAPIL